MIKSQSPKHGAESPMRRFGPLTLSIILFFSLHIGCTLNTDIVSDFTKARYYKVLWRFPQVNLEDENIHLISGQIHRGRPLISGNKLFFGSSHEKVLYCIDIQSGRILWKLDVDDYVECKPLMYKRNLYIGTSAGSLMRINPIEPYIIWKSRLDSEIFATPFIHEGRVFVHTASDNLFCVDSETGNFIWRNERDIPSYITIRGNTSPKIYNNILYAGFSDGILMAIDSENGNELWSVDLNEDENEFNDIDATPLILDDFIITATYDGNLFKLNKKDGTIVWKLEGYGGITQPVMDDGLIYFSSNSGSLVSVELDSGKIRWRYKLEKGIPSTPLVLGDTIFLGSSEDGLHVLDRRKKRGTKLVWKFDPGSGISTQPIYDDGHLYLITNNGYLYKMMVF